MASGTVKWFDGEKGFIAPDDGGEDVIVYVAAAELAGLYGLKEGQRLSYQLERHSRTDSTYADFLQVR